MAQKPLQLPSQRSNAPSFGTETKQISLQAIFGRKFEGAVIMRDFSLHTEAMRKLVERDYLFLSKMLHTITRTRDYWRIEHGPLNKIEDDLQDKIKSIRDLISVRRIELQKRFHKKPDATIDVTHARSTAFEAPIASPHANAYVDLLIDADEFIGQLTAAWLQGLFKSQEFNGAVREIKRAMHAVKADVTRARVKCFELLNRAMAGMAKDDPEHAQMKNDVAELALGIVADAKQDSDVQDALPVSAGHDLQEAAGRGEVAVPPGSESAPAPEATTAPDATPATAKAATTPRATELVPESATT